jgi:hypothetical protein
MNSKLLTLIAGAAITLSSATAMAQDRAGTNAPAMHGNGELHEDPAQLNPNEPAPGPDGTVGQGGFLGPADRPDSGPAAQPEDRRPGDDD